MASEIAKPVAPSSLVGIDPKRPGRKDGVVISVELVTVTSRRLDDDNAVAACKPLRDAIAAELGVDDSDPRVRWIYSNCSNQQQLNFVVAKFTLHG